MRDLEARDLLALIERTRALRAQVRAQVDLTHSLRGRVVALLFHEPSTRTRYSFEMACVRLGAHPLVFTSAGSSTSKGETLLDTARVLRAVGADAVVLRHQTESAPHALSESLGVPVINAGDGTHEHPTQALLDAVTMRDHFDEFEGLRVGIVGDIKHSRVARSNCLALTRLGAAVTVAGPEALCPPEVESLGVARCLALDDLLDRVDVLMMLRIQRERMGDEAQPDAYYRERWGLTAARQERLRPDAIVMHPAPMNRGVEIDDAVADGPRSVVFDQMANGVFARMAVLLDLMAPQTAVAR